jgi:hypothetical protein
MICAWRLCKNEVVDRRITKNTKYCSVNCKTKFWVTENRRKMKLKALDYKGGACERCGYNKCPGVLQFHHEDNNKKFGIGDGGTKSWERIRLEIDKCVLLCANCHAEEHYDGM